VQWPLLESLPAEVRAQVLKSARRRQFARGEIVFHEGDPGDSLHLIESGTFAVQVSTPAGERATLNVLASGGFFGELALVQDSRRRTATVLALEPAQTLALAGTAFAQLRDSHPAVERLVVAALAQRVDDLGTRLLESLYVGVDRRVYRRLVELAVVYSHSTAQPVIPLSQDDVATMTGASRPTVNQVLQQLVARGTISLGRRQITIRDLAALRAAAPNLEA
jgi:CRP/FNR family transcriptional regulator, cyclic AMP receptor protein